MDASNSHSLLTKSLHEAGIQEVSTYQDSQGEILAIKAYCSVHKTDKHSDAEFRVQHESATYVPTSNSSKKRSPKKPIKTRSCDSRILRIWWFIFGEVELGKFYSQFGFPHYIWKFIIWYKKWGCFLSILAGITFSMKPKWFKHQPFKVTKVTSNILVTTKFMCAIFSFLATLIPREITSSTSGKLN